MTKTILADLSNPDHAADFMKVLCNYAEDPMGGGSPLAQDVQDRLVPALKEQDSNRIVLCYVDDEIAGFANCFFGFSSFKAKALINIHDFAVMPKFRGQGLSKHLLDRVEEIARDKGCCKITLEVLDNNHKAKHVYQVFGFEGYELNPEMGKAEFWQKTLIS